VTFEKSPNVENRIRISVSLRHTLS